MTQRNKLKLPSRPTDEAPATAKRSPLRGGALTQRDRKQRSKSADTSVRKPLAPAGDPGSAKVDAQPRLSKHMAAMGIASRREADEWIERGWVRLDGQTATLGQKFSAGQTIEIDPAAYAQQTQQITILLNKPVGFVSGQAEHDYQPAVTLITPDNRWDKDHSGIRFARAHLRNLAPAGRLDIDSVGLLVMTQDGRIARQLIGEHSEIEKEYLVRVEYPEAPVGSDLTQIFPAAKLRLLNHGLSLDDKALLPAQVWWQNENQLRFILKEGKKRQIRRMCELVGLHVTGLKRIRIGGIMLSDLPVGQWRYLEKNETF